MSEDYKRIEIYCPVAGKKVCLLLNQKLLPIECSIDVTCRHQRTPLCYLRVEEKEATIKVGDIIFRKDMPEFRFRIVEENKEFPDCWTIEPVEKYRGFGRWREKRIVAKNDERWEVERSE